MALLSDARRSHAKRSLSRWARLWFVIYAFLLSVPVETLAETKAEYQLKAVFLFNFAQFVEWPPEAFPESQSPLIIGVLGEDPFGPYLDQIVAGENANNRALAVYRYRQVEEIKACHILFISRSEAGRLEQILTGLKGRHILTVGDTDGFATRGTMIRFVSERNRVRLKINLDAAKAANLTISSKLLRPAEIVTTPKN